MTISNVLCLLYIPVELVNASAPLVWFSSGLNVLKLLIFPQFVDSWPPENVSNSALKGIIGYSFVIER